MTLQEYLDLRNGANVRGIVGESVDEESATLTVEAASNIAKAFCVWLISHTGKTKVCVAVGYDTRESAAVLCEAVVEGIVSTGHDAIVTGLTTAPSMITLLKDENWKESNSCQGAIVLTAGNLPANYNGMRFFSENGELDASDVIEILEMAVDYRFAEPGEPGVIQEKEYLSEYAAAFVDKIREATGEVLPLGGRRIIVDAGNGIGGFFAYKVLVPLGADITGSQGLTSNEPLSIDTKAAIASVCEIVKNSEADLGLVFNADASKVSIIDKGGKAFSRNDFIALISAILFEEQAGSVVTDSTTSEELAKFIAAKGGKQYRYKCGHESIIAEARRLNAQGEYAPLAIDTCDNAALLENDFMDDGVYLAVRVLTAFAKVMKAGNTLSSLIAELKNPMEAAEIRIAFQEDVDYKTLGADIINELNYYAEVTDYTTLDLNNREGARIAYDDTHGNGWALVRTSLHEPVLAVNVECSKSGGTLKIAKDLYYFLRQFSCLNLSALEDAINQARQALIDGLHNRLLESPEFLDYLFPRAARGIKFVNGHVPTEEEKAAMETENLPEEQLAMELEEDAPVVAEESVEAEIVESAEAVEVGDSEQIEIPVLPMEESAE